MLSTWTLGLGTAVNFCKEAEKAAEQGGAGLSQELAFMLTLVIRGSRVLGAQLFSL